jgi:hypothetical protein
MSDSRARQQEQVARATGPPRQQACLTPPQTRKHTCIACRLFMLLELGRPWCRLPPPPPIMWCASLMPRLVGMLEGRGARLEGPSAAQHSASRGRERAVSSQARQELASAPTAGACLLV